jgi:hypothetical protein
LAAGVIVSIRCLAPHYFSSREVSFYYERVEGTWGICPSIGVIFERTSG